MSTVLHQRTLKKLSVVVPVYQNEGSLNLLFEELLKVEAELMLQGKILECIFVNDGSTDNSLEILKKIKGERGEWILINLTRNFGAVNCSRTGLGYVSGDAFIILAADLQDPPSLITQMVERWESGSDFVVCERETKALAKLFYSALRLFVIADYPVGGYDFALMDRKMLQPILESSKTMYTPILAWWLGFKPSVILYHRRSRKYGKSGWTLIKKVNAAMDIFLGFSNKPIRIMSSIGALVSMTSFLYGFVIIYAAISNRIDIPGYSTIVTLILFMFGLTILMLGILGEYLMRVLEEVNGRPFSVIASVE
jgi:dolichol-phosphate mannosyltransferase